MLKISARAHDDVLMVILEGTIDGGESCRKIYDVIKDNLASGGRKFIMNLGAVEWINSLGVGFLVAAAVSASRDGAVVRLFGLNPRVSTLLNACGVVPHVWPAFPDESTALQGL
jgi:anti-sigma B factor antagonist